MSTAAATVIVADDHPLFRAALRETVGRLLPEAAVVEAQDMAALESAVDACPEADLVLLDLHMPGAHGFSSLVFLRGHHPSVPVIVVSAAEGADVVRRAADFGASGFIPKSANLEVIAEAVAAVRDGNLWFPESDDEDSDGGDIELAERLASLTPQQFRVLMMIAGGLLNKQIAYELDVSEATVKAHVTAILRKLGLYSRTQAAVIAERLQIHPPRVAADAPAASG
ncbi:response regulator [Algiphilus sp.]|uniref:response regulator n=1 Tax=Algiphilus sp. TaxID=1872431 RepID=UPI0025BC9FEE|nr:response regulator transcription factor [Algiphilus sp.]MCK5768914.1 response regulator transcription factor [Algiphilus sp.]